MKKFTFELAGVYIVTAGIGFLLLRLLPVLQKRELYWYEDLGIFIFSMLIFVSFVESHSKLISRLNDMVVSFAKGNLNAEGYFISSDELGQLSESMKLMAVNLNNNMQKALHEKDQMETILASMAEGVLAFDIMGRLMLINKPAEEMLDVSWEQSQGHYFLEILRNYQIAELLNRCLANGNQEMGEVKLLPADTDYYRIYITPIIGKEGSSQGAVMVLRNITKMKQLEQMRSDFVANVSHELRTPLTSIKGYVETLLDGTLEDKTLSVKFLSVINAEADRLNRLISDLLYLSQLETGLVEVVKKPVDAKEVIDKIISLLQPVAENRNVTLKGEVLPGAEGFNANQDMIEQVIINLMENAIKYSYNGGEVKIEVKPHVEGVVISVIDQGIGIPAESLARIFERFYRVDKARSRQVGGTGLGLSIVKHIVERHGGKVLVESEEKKGSTISVVLPRK